MKASSHEKHAKQQWKKKTKENKKFRPMGQVWERPGRGHGSELFFVFFLFFHCFFSLAKSSRKQKQQKKKKRFRPMGKVWAIHTQTKKQKTTKKQETKKTKKQKNKKTKKQKNKIAHPKGRGQMQTVGSCLFVFFFVFFFLFFWFFVFFGLCLVCG